MNCGTEGRTGEESGADAQADGNAAFRAESVGFDVAADFLCSIVIAVNLMTFHTRDIRNASRKLAAAARSGAVDTVCLRRSVRYRQVSFLASGIVM